jgi:HSP20 family protein
MSRLSDELYRRFDGNGGRGGYRPLVDIFEDKESIQLRVDVPGVRKEDLHVNVERNLLTVSGERKLEQEERRDGYHRVERAYGTFSRSFSLPDTVDSENILAEMREGVLTLKLPKRNELKTRKIEIKQ